MVVRTPTCKSNYMVCYLFMQEYGDVRLFTVKPRLLLVFASDEAIKYVREILQTVSWDDVRYLTVV